MRVEFTLNGTKSWATLYPENARDKALLQLWLDGKPNIRVKPCAGDEVVLEALEPPPEPKDCLATEREDVG